MANEICFIVGHGKSETGGYDSGAVSKDGKYHEFKIVKEIAKYAQAYYNANYTEQADLMNYNGDLYLADRIKKANAMRYKLIAELHLNSSTSTSATGVECYYENKDSKGQEYADAICDQIALDLGVKQRPYGTDADGGDKVKLNSSGNDYFGIIRQPTNVDVRLLVEIVFISNASDLAKVNTPEGQKKAGEAIAKAVAKVRGAKKKVVEGWHKDSNGWYYINANGKKVINQWVKDSKGWCYVGADGYCVLNQWVEDSKGWCYVDANGYCLMNQWFDDDGNWCYLGEDGRALTLEWLKIDNRWYYFNEDCYAVKGMQKINGKIYYFAESQYEDIKECQLIITNTDGEIQTTV